jgi:hypothetical protein
MAQEDNTADRQDSASLEGKARCQLIELYHTTNQPRFLKAALQLQRQGTKLDEADFYRIKHEPPTAGRGHPTEDDVDMLWAMATLVRHEPDLGDKPYKLARRAAATRGVAEHSMKSVVKRLAEKWKTLPRQDGLGISAMWWADRLRAGGYAEDADQLLANMEKIRPK